MKTKTILSIAILATLPLTAMAENISGAMYVAPATATQNTPAPTTNASGPYGRINIDTTDKDHIASTAYVKGAYNSAIAAVNSKQDALYNDTTDDQIIGVNGTEDFLVAFTPNGGLGGENILVSEAAIIAGFRSQRVEIYTTWDNDNTIDVALKAVVEED